MNPRQHTKVEIRQNWHTQILDHIEVLTLEKNQAVLADEVDRDLWRISSPVLSLEMMLPQKVHTSFFRGVDSAQKISLGLTMFPTHL